MWISIKMKSRIQIRISIKITLVFCHKNVHTYCTHGTWYCSLFSKNAMLFGASKNQSVPTTLLEFEVAVLQLPVPAPLPPPFLLRSLSPSEPEKEFLREPEAEEFPLWLPLFFSPGRLDRVVLSLNNKDFKSIFLIIFSSVPDPDSIDPYFICLIDGSVIYLPPRWIQIGNSELRIRASKNGCVRNIQIPNILSKIQ